MNVCSNMISPPQHHLLINLRKWPSHRIKTPLANICLDVSCQQSVTHGYDIVSFRRINIGLQYQAEIPELQERSLVDQDEHKATLVWLPLSQAKSSPSLDETGES